MSRTEFREQTTSPRPRAAVVMVAIATLTLAITEQVSPLALAATLACIVFTAWQRERRHAWQENRLLLNAGLLGCLIVAAQTFRTGLAIVALAHFAVLAQGLQLLDARARRSEFLLVALSVLQVVLAANLTDHLAFPPLLVVFTMATVWTLTVHTLRAEALEMGEPEAAQQAISGPLLRTTAAASLLSILLAVFLFPMLPRIRSGSLVSKGIGSPIAISGFSESVELGDIGRIRLDPEVVLRIEPIDEPLPPAQDRYWRGLAFDEFDGRRWAVTPPERSSIRGDPEIGMDLGTRRLGRRIRQRITREKLATGVLFSPGLATVVRGDVGRLQHDAGGSLYGLRTAGDRIDYQIAADIRTPGSMELAADATRLPSEAGERYLQLPELDPAITELARKLVAQATTDAQRASALENHLRTHGRYTNDIPSHGADGRSPVESFLLEQTEGHCEYFASSMVVLARSVGLPARVVNGFAGGAVNPIGGFLEVTQSDAHTWVEIHYQHAGWVRYDPTPVGLRMAGAAALRGERWLASLTSAAELWWYRIVDFDRNSQGRVLRKAWLAWHGWRSGQRSAVTSPEQAPASKLPGLPGWFWGALAAGAIAAVGLGRLRHRRRAPDLPAFYARALRLLERNGLKRAPESTARSFAREVERKAPGPAAAVFVRITEAYLHQRFAGVPAGDRSQDLQDLRDSLRS
ncbi:MAG: DUF3488 domain-containing transglutaminase family protein [bacterium]|nr:DUF3488 domain-containing transglutaminase family protein [bacterium]